MILYAEKWNKSTENDDEQFAFLRAILISLPHFYEENHYLELPSPKDERLIPVYQYINLNYHYNTSTYELSSLANMSERNLQRIFKQETGITLQKYIQLIRILKRIEFIDTKQYTLTEIAFKVGYKSLSAFTNSFMTIMKVAPKKKKYLNAVGETIYKLFKSYDKDATWIMQSWSLREDIASVVPHGDILVLSLNGWDGAPHYFCGHNYVVGNLHNFGGRVNLHGDLQLLASNQYQKAKEKSNKAVGSGLFMEALNQNPVFYDLAFEMPLHNDSVDLSE